MTSPPTRQKSHHQMKRFALLCLTWCLITAASRHSNGPVGGLTALHREFESPESQELRLNCPSTEEFLVEDALTGPTITGVADSSPKVETDSFIPLGDFLSSLEAVISRMKPESSLAEPPRRFLQLHQKFLKERCESFTGRPFLYHICSTRLQELKTLLAVLEELYQSLPEDLNEHCSQLASLFMEARSLVKTAFLAQTKYLDTTYPFLHVLSQRALKRFEATTPEALQQFRLFETALESIDMDVKMHCNWPYLDLNLWQETRTVIYEFIYLSIF